MKHEQYLSLGKTNRDRQNIFFSLFDNAPGRKDVDMIRVATIQDSVIGNNKLKKQIEQVLKMRVKKHSLGGDRKSVELKHQQDN